MRIVISKIDPDVVSPVAEDISPFPPTAYDEDPLPFDGNVEDQIEGYKKYIGEEELDTTFPPEESEGFSGH